MYDLHFSVYVGTDLKLKDFKSLCAEKCGISDKKLQLYFNNVLLVGDNKTLKSLNCTDNGLILLQLENHDNVPNSVTSSYATSSNRRADSNKNKVCFLHLTNLLI